MHIRRLTIENFRKFRERIELAGFSDGLNLICEANEFGKSTLLEAMRAVLFERHSSRNDRIRSFRPYGEEVAPSVAIDFTLNGETWHLEKRFLQAPTAVLVGPGYRATNEEAEDKLQALLGFGRAGNRGADDDSRGTFGLLWVEQGQSFVMGPPGPIARRTLEGVLAAEIGAVTEGRQSEAIVRSIQASFSELMTPTGRPARRLAEAQAKLERAEASANQALRELAEYESCLEKLDTARNAYRQIVDALSNAAETSQLALLNTDIERAKTAANSVRTAQLFCQQATQHRERLCGELKRRRDLRDAIESAKNRVAIAAAEHERLQAVSEAAKSAEKQTADALEQARRLATEAESNVASCRALLTQQRHARALAAAFKRLDQIESISRDVESVRRRVDGRTVSDEQLLRLQQLEQDARDARTAAAAGAALLAIELTTERGDVTVNGELAPRSSIHEVVETKVVDVAGVGTITVSPAEGVAAAQTRVVSAQQTIDAMLQELGFASTAEVHSVVSIQREAGRNLQLLRLRLDAASPPDAVLGIAGGPDALRTLLSTENRYAIEELAQVPDADIGATERVWRDSRRALAEAEDKHRHSMAARQQTELSDVRLAAAVEGARSELNRLAATLTSEREAPSDDELIASLAEAEAAEARAIIDRNEVQRSAQGLNEATLVSKRDELVSQRERLKADQFERATEIAKLEERAQTRGADGPASRAVEADEQLQVARAACEQLREEAEVLRLLTSTIAGVQQDTARRFVGPITKRLEKYLERILPAARVGFSDDYRPHLIARNGQEELTEDLSKGTQEQIAVLARLALAEILAERGQPVSIVLDDALVFADDHRFETMLDILEEAAARVQIIVLSCRTSAYSAFNALRIQISNGSGATAAGEGRSLVSQ